MAVSNTPWPPAMETMETRLMSNVGLYRSPLTGSVQRLARSGAYWQFRVRFQPLTDLQRREWATFLAYKQDEGSTFYWGPYPYGRPYDYASATLGDTTAPWASGGTASNCKINGASQAGTTLAVDGLAVGATFRAGDWLAFSNGTYRELHMIKDGQTANGSGQITFNIVPAIRISPADNAVVYFDGNITDPATRCAGEFMLVDNQQAGWSSSFDFTNDFEFMIREALAA